MTKFTLIWPQGTISFNYSLSAAHQLKEKIGLLIESLKQISQGKIPSKPFSPMEYQYTGQVFLEVFCNPNIYPSPFAAKVLITVRDEKIRITTETELNYLIESLENYINNNKENIKSF